MKRKITALALVIVIIISAMSLSSCYMLTSSAMNGFFGTDNKGDGGITNVTVNGGDDYEISIDSDKPQETLGAAKALLSSVSIVCAFERYALLGGQKETYYSAGSGVIYQLDKEQGNAYIITNYHVVYDANSNTKNKISNDIKLYLYGQEYADYEISASYVGGSMLYDLAVLEIKNSTVLMQSPAAAVSVADSNNISILDMAIAIGNPEGEGISATVGYVNVDSEEIDMLASDNQTQMQLRVIRTDAAVNSGNSGGGLFNSRGELIGIVNAKMSSDEVDNIGYAIPSNVAKAIADNVIYYCADTDCENVKRVMMGITVSSSKSYSSYDKESGKVRKYETVTVKEVTPTSFVKDIIKAGDIINSITIDGVSYEVTRIFHVVDSMLNARPTSVVSMNITRNGNEISVSVPINESMLTVYK